VETSNDLHDIPIQSKEQAVGKTAKAGASRFAVNEGWL
jgi:hypothetical protein